MSGRHTLLLFICWILGVFYFHESSWTLFQNIVKFLRIKSNSLILLWFVVSDHGNVYSRANYSPLLGQDTSEYSIKMSYDHKIFKSGRWEQETFLAFLNHWWQPQYSFSMAFPQFCVVFSQNMLISTLMNIWGGSSTNLLSLLSGQLFLFLCSPPLVSSCSVLFLNSGSILSSTKAPHLFVSTWKISNLYTGVTWWQLQVLTEDLQVRTHRAGASLMYAQSYSENGFPKLERICGVGRYRGEKKSI